MKVIYKKSIVQQIIDESIRANELGLSIDKFVLSVDEMDQLKFELNSTYGSEFINSQHDLKSVNGIAVECEV